jgi:hypothetical protein
MRGALCTSPSLEDYCMSMQENRQAKEIEELEAVMRFQSQRLLMGA